MNPAKHLLKWLFSLEGTKAGNILLPSGIMGGGVMHCHTLTQAQKYTVNWEPIIKAFPICKEFPDVSKAWHHMWHEMMGPQGEKDPEMWAFIDQFRRKEGVIRAVRDKMMTTAFVDFVVDQLQAETSEFGDFKFHQCGLGTTNEAITDVGIETDTGITAVAGTQTETDHDTYKSVATMTMDATEAITEHTLESQTAGAGTLMDRTEFGVINVVSGNQIEFTFEGSFTAGG